MNCISLFSIQRSRYFANPDEGCYISDQVLYINCVCYDKSGGGAIACFPNGQFTFWINESTFTRCSAIQTGTQKSFGGAIVFNSVHTSSKQQMIIDKCCSNMCSSSFGTFLSSCISYSEMVGLEISNTALQFSSKPSSAGIWLQGTSSTIKYLNVSNSRLNRDVCMQIKSPSCINCSFSSMVTNVALYSSCLTSSTALFYSCNFYNNTVLDNYKDYAFFVLLSGDAIISSSIFQLNGFTFSIRYGFLSLVDCFFDTINISKLRSESYSISGGDTNTYAPTLSIQINPIESCKTHVEFCYNVTGVNTQCISNWDGFLCTVISHCIFNEIRAAAEGGAIYSLSSCLSFIIESSTFTKCTADEYGGCMFLSGPIQQIIIKETCSDLCDATMGAFFYHLAFDSIDPVFVFNLSSVNKCPGKPRPGQMCGCTSYYYHNYFQVYSINSSNHYTGYVFSSFFISAKARFTFSTITGSHSNTGGAIRISDDSFISHFNFINNTQSVNQTGHFMISNHISISNFISMNNYNLCPLFYSSNASLSVFEECYIDSILASSLIRVQNTPVFTSNIPSYNFNGVMFSSCYQISPSHNNHVPKVYSLLYVVSLFLASSMILILFLFYFGRVIKKPSNDELLGKEILNVI